MTNEQLEVELTDNLFTPVWREFHTEVEERLFWNSTIEVEFLFSHDLIISFEGDVDGRF